MTAVSKATGPLRGRPGYRTKGTTMSLITLAPAKLGAADQDAAKDAAGDDESGEDD